MTDVNKLFLKEQNILIDQCSDIIIFRRSLERNSSFQEIPVRRLLPLLSLMLLPACATIVNGSSQTVSISTDPAGSVCTVERSGSTLGIVNPTPGTVHVDKSKNDLSIRCTHDGYQPGLQSETASFGGATFGNIVAGGIIGVAVDAASGANYSYPADVHMTLAPSPVAAAPVAGATPVVYRN